MINNVQRQPVEMHAGGRANLCDPNCTCLVQWSV